MEKGKKQSEECEEYLAGWKKARADLLNYKKDEGERMGEMVKYSIETTVKKILPILDNLYIAEENRPDELKDNEWVEGMLQVKNQMAEFLKNEGVEEIKAEGKEFDPNFHEALEIVEHKGKSNIVIKEISKGYIYNNRVIRPVKVRISK